MLWTSVDDGKGLEKCLLPSHKVMMALLIS